MPTITVRNVPPDIRDRLAAKAALRGQSLQEFLRLYLIESASKPTVEEIFERARKRLDADPSRLTTEKILKYRDADRE